MARVTCQLTDFGYDPMTDTNPLVIFTHSTPGVAGTSLLSTKPLEITPARNGYAEVDLVPSAAIAPAGYYTVAMEWTARRPPRRRHREEFPGRLYVPAAGGVLGDLLRVPANPGLVFKGAEPPANPSPGSWWLGTDGVLNEFNGTGWTFKQNVRGPAGFNAVGAEASIQSVADWITGTAGANAVSKAVAGAGAAAALPNRRRSQYEIRRASAGPVRLAALPDRGGISGNGFGWLDAPLRVFREGNRYTTDFDVAKFKNKASSTVYVDPFNGDNTKDGLTRQTPLATLYRAMNSVATGGTIVVLGAGLAYRQSGFNAFPINKSLNIIADQPGKVSFAMSDDLAWTAGPGNAYTAPRSNVSAVVDRAAGAGFRYAKASTLAQCQSTPGSWYQDGANLVMHTLDGSKPNNTRHLALLQATGWWIEPDTTDVSVYIEGINLIGGEKGGNIFANGKSGRACDLYMKNSELSFATGAAYNSLTGSGARYVFLQNVTAHNSRKDGLNYTATNDAVQRVHATRFIEVDCHSHTHGVFEPATANNNNASTAHAGAKGIRLGGTYHHTYGGVIADVNEGTQSVNYSCTAYDPLTGTKDGYDAVFVAQQAGADMWAFACTFFGATGWDVVALPGTSVTLDETSFDSRTGAAYTTVTNEI